VLLLVVSVLLFVVVTIQLRGGAVTSGGMLQQQLVELRARLESLASAQQQLPQAIAEGKADQIQSLADVRVQLERVAEATGRLEALGASVSEVQELLRVPRLRGVVGEVWLEELLRQVFPAGLHEVQYVFKSGERVDAVLRVGGRLVPIDSKFPLEACQRMLRAEGADRERERRAFRRSLREHVDEIANKYIKPDEGTFEFALMYVPAENVYYEAVVRGDDSDGSSLSEYALDKKVIPVSPNTFYAYVSALIYGLRGLEVERSARRILDSLGSLEQEFMQFGRAHDLLGKHLANAVRQYDQAEVQLSSIRQRFEAVKRLENGGCRASGGED
jgi:DNA recombination protein RmuC